MSDFSDNLSNGTWTVQANNGQFLAYSSTLVDGNGKPLLTTVATRSAATKFRFNIINEIDDNNLSVSINAAGQSQYLTVNGAGSIVLDALSTAQSQFTASRVRSQMFVLGWNLSGVTGSYFNLNTTTLEFTAASLPQGQATGFHLAPDLPSGSVLWQFLNEDEIQGTPNIFGGAVFVGDVNTLINCLELGSGFILWEYGNHLKPTSPPEVDYVSNIVYVGSDDGHLHAVNMDDGSLLWSVPVSSKVFGRPAAFTQIVFVPLSEGKLCALSSTDGSLLWTYPANGNLGGIFSSPYISGGVVYVGGWDNKLHAVNAATGAEVWTCALGDHVNGGILTTANQAFVGCDNNSLNAVNLTTGALNWTAATGGIVTGTPALYNGQVLIADFAGNFYSFDEVAGTQNWTLQIGDFVGSDVIEEDGIAYFCTTTGKVYAVGIAQKTVSASYDTHSRINGSPTLFSGTVCVGNAAGDLIAFSSGLNTTFNPTDAATMLFLSDYANRIDISAPGSPPAPQTPPLFAGVTRLNSFFAAGDDQYASAALFQMRLAATDQVALVLALGVNTQKYFSYYDAAHTALTSVPNTITGTLPAAGVQAIDMTLTNYLAMRASILSAIAAAGVPILYVTGIGEGGALATLAALDCGISKTDVPTPIQIGAYTFGSPAVGSQAFANLFNQQVTQSYRIVSQMDMAPESRKPADGYYQVNSRITVGQNLNISGACGADDTGCYRICLTGLM